MALFRFKWLRKLIRKKTNPIPYEIANRNKLRLSLLYAFLAWNAFGLVLFQIFRGKADWATHHGLEKDQGTSAQRYATILGIEKAKVIRFGKEGKEEYEINSELKEEEVSEFERE